MTDEDSATDSASVLSNATPVVACLEVNSVKTSILRFRRAVHRSVGMVH